MQLLVKLLSCFCNWVIGYPYVHACHHLNCVENALLTTVFTIIVTEKMSGTNNKDTGMLTTGMSNSDDL